ncbi:MAG: DUF1015 domain-containing protein [Eubacteriaceae bacterium]|jgi:uncharacterized protein (DUF1015 family)
MAIIKPFKAVRPVREEAAKIAALPYDVYNREEATEEVRSNPDSFLTVDRAETTMPDDVATYDQSVYQKARENLDAYRKSGKMEQDDTPSLYIYELTMDGRSQTGLVATTSVDEYDNGIIKKHELTRADKEQDRIHHVDACNANTGPIFLTYRKNADAAKIIADQKQTEPMYDFTSADGIRHRVWLINDQKAVDGLVGAFAEVPCLYIADGHHRCASAVKVAKMRREQNPGWTGNEEFNYFLSVLFPDEELRILDYNRVVRDLNGLTSAEFLKQAGERFDIAESGQQVRPEAKGEFGMYLDGRWYKLTVKPEFLKQDPVGALDVSVLYDNLLAPVLGIGDPRTDGRIDFVGGIRGLDELERRTQNDMKVAFSMYPTSISELMAIADAGLLMPPKSTWFEPKLRSGLFIHELS